jgi:hypothetical protein
LLRRRYRRQFFYPGGRGKAVGTPALSGAAVRNSIDFLLAFLDPNLPSGMPRQPTPVAIVIRTGIWLTPIPAR